METGKILIVQINALIFKHLHLNDTFWECMKYLDTEREVPNDMKEMFFVLQIVRITRNIQEQFTEDFLKKTVDLFKSHNLNTDSFLLISKHLQRKYLD